MAETRTSRFGLVQWGVGTDSPSRIDFNEAFLSLETLAAQDTGTTYATLPTTGLHAGRYAWVSAGGDKSLYRYNDAAGWDFIGGTTDPQPFKLRPANGVSGGGPALSANALTVSHPDGTNPGAEWAYDGSSILGGTQRVYDRNDATKGLLHVGVPIATAGDPMSLGRVHVRTRANSERGLVLRPHASGAGAMLVAQTAGGTDVLTVDAVGSLHQTGLSGFGGAAVPTDATTAIAPTSNVSDGTTTGLWLYGQDSPGDTKSILRVTRNASDTAPTLSLGRDNHTIGRLPWGSTSTGGVVALAGRQLTARATGYTSDAVLWKLTQADLATPDDTGLDNLVASYGRAAALVRTPLTVTQELSTGGVDLTLKRYTNFSGRFLELQRATSGTEVVSAWEADGRLQLGARWISSGTMRDARQGLRHSSLKRWAIPNVDGYNAGIKIDVGAVPTRNYTYTFGTMTMRSVGTCDLDIKLESEYCLEAEVDDFGNASFYEVSASVNGGAFNSIEIREFWGVTVVSGDRPVGVNPHIETVLQNVPAGASVQIRVKITNNGSAFGPPMYLRMLNVNIEESLITEYTAPA